MARKGREPLVEAPPPAASSSDEEEHSSDEEEPEPEPEEQQRHSSSGEEDEEDAEENSPSPPPPPPPPKAPTQKKPDSESHSDSDSDSGSDSDAPASMVKPLESKPMKPGNLKKSRSKPVDSTPAKVTVLASPAPVAKRRGSEEDKGTAKKARREKVEPVAAPQDEGKKPLFQRLWSDDDEVAILRGIIDYKAEKGIDPMADADDFLDFVKESLHVNANRAQIMSKIRALKRKFETAKKRKKITDPHGLKLFELSKKIWESDVAVNNGVVDRKESNSRSRSVKKKAGNVDNSKAGKNTNGPVSEDEEEEGDEKMQNWVISRDEGESKLEDLGNFGFVKDGILKEGIKLLDEEEKAKLDDKWRKQSMAEMEIYLKRLDLIRELTRKTLNAMKSA